MQSSRHPEGDSPAAVIGVDVGGTHTDVCAAVGASLERGKALTTYDDFSRGVLDAVAVAAENHGLSLQELLGRTRLFVNGTTVVTNSITELSGSDVGIICTAGFKDTFRFAGGPRQAIFDDHLQVNAPDLVAPAAIAEVEERIDYAGNRLVSLNVEQLKEQVTRLVEEVGVEAVAVCFVSSFVEPAHEREAEAVIRELYPDLFLTLSHQVFPVRGENRRWTTAVLNSFVQKRAQLYLDSLNVRLREAGLTGGLVFFQGLGGGISVERAKEYPLALLGSGPAGGAIGAAALAKRLGEDRVLLGDMGGTSFDTGIVVDGELHLEKNLDIGLLKTGVNIVDVVSVGAGGGSIAWVGERGVPQVGPRSAASTPGPASYGKGGDEPTVTDAMVSLGFIDPDRYLGGRFKLYPDKAAAALREKLGDRFSWTVEEAATAVHDLVVVNMAHAVREVSVQKGHDPRNFVFFAYGGTLPLFAGLIAERLGITKVIIPSNSSVFCALGLLAADFVVRYDQTVAWELGEADDVERINRTAEEMIARGVGDIEREGFARDEIGVARSADFRFAGQSYELTMALPDRPLTAADGPQLAAEFRTLYERTYGEGTAWKGVPSQLLNLTVTVTGRQPGPPVEPTPLEPRTPDEVRRETRNVHIPARGAYVSVPVYDDSRFTAGTEVEGPAIIDATDTTVYVPPDATVARDESMNYVMTIGGESR